MASLSTKSDGSREIYIVIGDTRPKIQLGKIPKKGAERVLAKVESLLACNTSGSAPDGEVSAWLGSLPYNDKLLERLVALGLTAARPKAETEEPVKQTIKTLVDKFVIHKRPLIAKSSIEKLQGSLARLTLFLGDDRDITTITVGDASAFESWGRKEGASEAHQRTLNRYAKQVASFAVDHGWIPSNPFRKLKSTALAATTRHYVSPEDTESLLNACPCLQWKILIGLARYAGLRVPSEAFAITWDMVDWDRKALFIPSKKTRRYAESRVCPILPELMTLLEKGFDQAPEGAETIVALSNGNVRRKLPDIIKNAKLKPWEDLFQTLRRSCETHFVSLGHPTHAVSTWLGHSNQVSKDHYLMITSDAFTKATETKTDLVDRPKTRSLKSGAESGAVSSRNDSQGQETSESTKKVAKTANEASPGDFQGLLENATKCEVVRGGLEPPTHGFSVRCSTN